MEPAGTGALLLSTGAGFCLRKSQGATGFGSCQRPRLKRRASASRLARVLSLE
uniref:MprA protease, GlyGly-CTERM protein-sorting domain-containing form n=1 Tax=Pontibacter amylolyticus TaxID=1424080 RepID=UPI003570C0AE